MKRDIILKADIISKDDLIFTVDIISTDNPSIGAQHDTKRGGYRMCMINEMILI